MAFARLAWRVIQQSGIRMMVEASFIAQASDPDAVIWSLKIDQMGKATLLYDDDEVAELPAARAADILRTPANPAERAEDLVAAISPC